LEFQELEVRDPTIKHWDSNIGEMTNHPTLVTYDAWWNPKDANVLSSGIMADMTRSSMFGYFEKAML
jgi:hypothetical protein